jgi:hypothetical protein
MQLNRELIAGAVVAVLAFTLSWGIQSQLAQARESAIRASYLAQIGDVQADMEVVRIDEVSSIEEILAESFSERQDLLDRIVTLNEDIEGLRFVASTRGSLLGSEPEPIIIRRNELPPEHVYETGGLTIAEFKVEDLGDTVSYSFPTYDLEVEASFVIGESKASVDVVAWTSFDPETRVRIAQDSQVFDLTKEHKVLTPQIGLGITTGYPSVAPSGSLWFSTIHPNPSLDLAVLRFSGNAEALAIGIDPISYNVGKPLPVLTNLWIAPGVSLDTLGRINGNITIGAKL